jgi:flagellar motor protein MotB
MSQRRWLVWTLGACLTVVGLGGCVSQQEYDRLVDTNRSLKATNADLQAQLDDRNRLIGTLRGETGSASDSIAGLSDANAALRAQLAAAQDQIRRFEDDLASMSMSRLDPVTDSALRDLANRYPGLVTYDPDRGMLRFASDLTFDSGSAVVRASAGDSLRALAGILNSSDAMGYDARIVGHTDSQRISAATAQRHPTNMHLSAHRAIAVRDALIGLGVAAGRMEAAGWGEYRPAVANTSTGNTPENRRVEIYMVRGSGGNVGAGAPASSGSIELDRDAGSGGFEPVK